MEQTEKDKNFNSKIPEVHKSLMPNKNISSILSDFGLRRNKIESISQKIIHNKTLTDEEKKIWDEKLKRDEENLEKSKEAILKAKNYKEKEPILVDYKELSYIFLKAYKFNEGVDFISNESSRINIKTLLLYFSNDNTFFKSPIINKNITIGNTTKTSNPSFEKGVLIVGGYGVSKSSSIKAIKRVFNFITRKTNRSCINNFKYYTVNKVVEMYETSKDEIELGIFWKDMTSGTIVFDDLKTEPISNRYGKKDIMKDVLEKRNDLKLKTHLIINYNPQFNNDLVEAIKEIGVRYGGRVFDRLFMDFNILEFKGKSFRN